jgi:predicted ATPase
MPAAARRQELEHLVHDALAHLHEPGVLARHPLCGAAPGGGTGLRRWLVDGVDALRPGPGAPAEAGRAHRILRDRFVEGTPVPALCRSLALSRSAYFRAQARAIDELAALLRRDLAEEPPDRAPLPLRLLRGGEGTRGGLPAPLTSFVGRERELAELEELLATGRLLTLTGAGGAGKTRLALALAARQLPAFPDGAWFTDLAPTSDPALVPKTVAAALGLRELPDLSPTASVIDHARARTMLLVLDNCEHVVAACAALAEALLRACPDLRIVATSRERLGTPGEVAWRVPSLSVPDAGEPPAAEALAGYPAVRLFVERARSVRPDFRLTEENGPAVGEVCRRLDGIPLAIELAAAQSRLLSVEQTADRLTGRFRLLENADRAGLPRHRTLRALIDWSHDLLAEPERTLLRRLSVFAGGWTLEAAEAVCAGGAIATEDVLELLARLVDTSLVVVDEPGGEARYRLLETIRQYAAEQLRGAGEEPQLRRRHVGWMVDLAERALPELMRPDQAAWYARLEQEHDNIRAALRWAHESGEGETGRRLCGALWRFWGMHAHYAEARLWSARLLAVPAHGPESPAGLRARAGALYAGGFAAFRQGDLPAARAACTDAVALARDAGDADSGFWALHVLGMIDRAQGDYADSAARLEEAYGLAQSLGDDRGTFYRCVSLIQLGDTARCQQEYGRARVLLEESLALQRLSGDRALVYTTAVTLLPLGHVAHEQGDHAAARTCYEEALELARKVGSLPAAAAAITHLGYLAIDRDDADGGAELCREGLALYRKQGSRMGVASGLEGLAGAAAVAGQPERALRLAGQAAALRAAAGLPLSPGEGERLDRWLAPAREAAGGAAASHETQGRALPLGQAIAEAFGD